MAKRLVDELLLVCMAAGDVHPAHFKYLGDETLVSILHYKGDLSYSIPQLLCLAKIHTMVTSEIFTRIPSGQTVANWIAKHTTR